MAPRVQDAHIRVVNVLVDVIVSDVAAETFADVIGDEADTGNIGAFVKRNPFVKTEAFLRLDFIVDSRQSDVCKATIVLH